MAQVLTSAMGRSIELPLGRQFWPIWLSRQPPQLSGAQPRHTGTGSVKRDGSGTAT